MQTFWRSENHQVLDWTKRKKQPKVSQSLKFYKPWKWTIQKWDITEYFCAVLGVYAKKQIHCIAVLFANEVFIFTHFITSAKIWRR